MQATGVMGLSADGRTLVLCGTAKQIGRITFWNVAGGLPRQVPGALPPLTGLVESMTFSSDGRILATGGAREIAIWDVAKRSLLRTFKGHPGVVAMAPGGRLLVSGALDGTVRLWNPVTGQALAVLHGHTARVSTVALSPRGDSLASAGNDGKALLWDLNLARLRETARRRSQSEILSAGSGAVGGLAFSPDGRLLAVARAESTSMWNVATRARVGQPLWQEPGPATARSLMRRGCAFDLAGGILATATSDGGVKLWDVASRRGLETLRGHQVAVTGLAFAAGETLITANGGGSTGVAAKILSWDVAGRGGRARLRSTVLGDPRIPQAALAASSDGRMVAARSATGQITVWDAPLPADSRAERAAQPAPRVTMEDAERVMLGALAFSPDGKLLAGGSSEGIVHVWDRATGKQLRRLMGHVGPVLSLSFAPDGRTLASGGMDRSVRLWNPNVDQQEAALTGHRDWIWTLAFSPDGSTLASGSPDGTVRLWRAPPIDGVPGAGGGSAE